MQKWTFKSDKRYKILNPCYIIHTLYQYTYSEIEQSNVYLMKLILVVFTPQACTANCQKHVPSSGQESLLHALF